MTGDETGTISPMDLRTSSTNLEGLKSLRRITRKRYLTDVRIQDTIQDDLSMLDDGATLVAFANASALATMASRLLSGRASEATTS